MTAQINEAEIKLRLFRWIDQMPQEKLVSFFESIKEDVTTTDEIVPPIFSGDLDQGYAAMAADDEGEKEAYEWIEGVINIDSL